MRKIAVFVEGLTEQELVAAIIRHVVEEKDYQIQFGRQFRNKIELTSLEANGGEPEFFVLIVDCATDGQVKTQIRDRYLSLVAQNYTHIIGVRDVFPHKREDIGKIVNLLQVGLPTGAILPKIHLAVMEVEAWFLDEVTHFERVHKTLTVDHISKEGFDLSGNGGESWDHPAETLDQIYQLAKCRYITKDGKKVRRRIMRTIEAISMKSLLNQACVRNSSLRIFVDDINSALFC